MTKSAQPDLITQQAPSVPPGWSKFSVAQLIQKHFCGPSPDCEERQIASGEEWGVLKTTAIMSDGWNEAAHKVLPRSHWGRRDLEVQHGDVLVTKAGPRDRVGVVVHVTSQPKRLIVSGKMIGLRARTGEVLPQVLAGVLRLRNAQAYVHARTTGMAESQVNFANTVLLDTEVCIPPIIEQHRIAAVLDTVEEAIAKTQAVTAKLKQVRIGLLHDVLTRGLDKHGHLRDPIAHPEEFQDSPVGRIPREWEVDTLVSRISFPEGQVNPRELPYSEWVLVAPDHIESESGRLISRQTAREQGAISGKYVCQPGDVVYSKIRPHLRKAVLAHERGLCSADMYPLRPADGVNSRFLLAVLLGESFSRFAAAVSMRSGFPKINREELAEFVMAWPQANEQQRIAAALSVADDEQTAIEKELTKLQKLKSCLMYDLLTGRVRVPETITTGPA